MRVYQRLKSCLNAVSLLVKQDDGVSALQYYRLCFAADNDQANVKRYDDSESTSNEAVKIGLMVNAVRLDVLLINRHLDAGM